MYNQSDGNHLHWNFFDGDPGGDVSGQGILGDFRNNDSATMSANGSDQPLSGTSTSTPDGMPVARGNGEPSFGDRLLDIGEKVWTSPNTLLGLVAGGASLPFGGHVSLEHGAIVFNQFPLKVGSGGALTLGNAILSTGPSLKEDVPTYTTLYNAPHGLPPPPNPVVEMGPHEEGHVHQAGVLGPLFLPVYGLQSLFSNDPSPLEKAADIYGQTGRARGHGEADCGVCGCCGLGVFPAGHGI